MENSINVDHLNNGFANLSRDIERASSAAVGYLIKLKADFNDTVKGYELDSDRTSSSKATKIKSSLKWAAVSTATLATSVVLVGGLSNVAILGAAAATLGAAGYSVVKALQASKDFVKEGGLKNKIYMMKNLSEEDIIRLDIQDKIRKNYSESGVTSKIATYFGLNDDKIQSLTDKSVAEIFSNLNLSSDSTVADLLKFVQKDPLNITFVPKKFRTDEMMLTALKNPASFQYIKDEKLSIDIKKAAIEANPYLLTHFIADLQSKRYNPLTVEDKIVHSIVDFQYKRFNPKAAETKTTEVKDSVKENEEQFKLKIQNEIAELYKYAMERYIHPSFIRSLVKDLKHTPAMDAIDVYYDPSYLSEVSNNFDRNTLNKIAVQRDPEIFYKIKPDEITSELLITALQSGITEKDIVDYLNKLNPNQFYSEKSFSDMVDQYLIDHNIEKTWDKDKYPSDK